MQIIVIAMLAVVSACGSDEGGTLRTESPTPIEYRLASAISASPFAPDPAEPAFWDLFRAYASDDYDLRQPRDQVFNAGISACGLLRTGALPKNVMLTIRRVFRLGQDGAEAVTAAASETICPSLRGLVKTLARYEAGRIHELLEGLLSRNTILLTPAYRNAKIACRELSRSRSPGNAAAAIRSEGERFMTVGEDDAAVRQLVRVAGFVHCPVYSDLYFGTPDG